MIQLTLLTREGCHLCDRMKRVVAKAAEEHPITLTEVDIGTRADLGERYGHDIPVLMRDEDIIARYRVSVSDLLERLAVPTKENG